MDGAGLRRLCPRSLDGTEPLGRARSCLGGLLFPVLGRSGCFERMQKVGGDVGYVVHRMLEGRFIALGGLVKAADFSDELERSCPNLFAGDGRLKVEERFDIAAHFLDLSLTFYP